MESWETEKKIPPKCFEKVVSDGCSAGGRASWHREGLSKCRGQEDRKRLHVALVHGKTIMFLVLNFSFTRPQEE